MPRSDTGKEDLASGDLESGSLPGTAVADDLHVDVVAGLVLVQRLDELLVHPRVKLAHPGGNFC